MSDIPVGSPPTPPGRHAAPSGWYPDPVDLARERYWDGWQWSRNTRPRPGFAASEPAAQAQPGEGTEPAGPQPEVPGEPGQQPRRWPGQPGQPPSSPGSWPGQQPQQSGAWPGQQPEQPAPWPGQPPQQQGPWPGQHTTQGQLPGGYYAAPQYPPAYPGVPYGARAVAQTADGVPLAGWWWRALAVVIDTLLVGLIAGVIASPIYLRLFRSISAVFAEAMRAAQAGEPAPALPTTALLSSGDQFALTLITLLVGLAYHVVFLRLKSATPGKLAVGLRVVPVDAGHSRAQLPWNTAIVRAIVWVLPTAHILLILVRIADVLLPLWHPKRQSLHDLAAKTQVVKPR